ncbi:hypothetical protein [Winogradskyella poriferorum]|uniref:Uncharacterized protein n=1 Tax=Winogradskyella poriferorum TaxID=307627 RepID=A0ABU7W3H7_9FLAO
MVEKEYLSVSEIAKQKEMTTRNVRRIIKDLCKTKSKDLIRKNKLNQWEVHHLLKHNFKRRRKHRQQYFALSFQTYSSYTFKDLDNILKNVFDRIDDPKLEINYTKEKKKSNGKPHIHSFIKTSTKKNELLRTLKLLCANLSYHESKIFDLKCWKSYITKDGGQIITLKKERDEER